MKIWIWLNHPKCHFKRSERSNLAPFFTWRQLSQKLFDNLFFIYARSFPRRVLMNWSKCHFERSEKGQIGLFCYNFLQNCLFFFFFFISCIQLLGDDIDQLSRDGINCIIQKVILKVGKVRFGQFSHNYWYYSVVAKCCPNLLHHVASLLWKQSCPTIWTVWNHSKGHFQGQKGPVCTFISANISETVHSMIKVCMKYK